MDWKAATTRIFEALEQELARHPRGTAARIERALGRRPSYLGKARQRRRLRIDTLLRCLDVLGVEPVAFFRRALGPNGDRTFEVTAVHVLRDALANLVPAEAARRADLVLTKDASTPRAASPAEDLATVEQLDRLRYAEPEQARDRARRLARRAAEHGQDHLAGRAAGVWGSSLRLCYDFDGAWVVLVRALDQAGDDEALQAEMMRRLAVLSVDEARPRLADMLLKQATLIHLDRGEHEDVTKRQVDRARILNEFGAYEKAVALVQSALVSLPAEEVLYRGTAWIIRGLAQLELGVLDDAALCIENVRKMAKGTPALESRLHWLRARFLRAQGDSLQAIHAYEASAEAFGNKAGDRALVTVELIHSLLDTGQPVRACHVARSLAPMVFHIGNPVLEAAVAELVRSALEGAVSGATIARFNAALARRSITAPGQRVRKRSR